MATEDANGVVRILAVDVGAGTQDVLVYESDRAPENCVKLVVPAQTRVVAGRIQAVTAAERPLHLAGTTMGGGASSDAVTAHLAAELPVTATPAAARTIHNDLARVRAAGIEIALVAPPGAEVVGLMDVDLAALGRALGAFGVALPETVAVAVQDHGYRPGSGNNDVRFEYLQGLIDGGGDLAAAVFREPPPAMTRMAALCDAIPGVYVMDTGAAAVLGALGDPLVGQAAAEQGAILVNVGNMHTFATLVKGTRLYGLFEHHTGGITVAIIADLVERLRAGNLDNAAFGRDFDGHGAALSPAYREEGPFPFVAVTGPNRGLARGLGYHEAAPHGDMMLAGAYGLVEGVLMGMAAAGDDRALTLNPAARRGRGRPA